jgi:cytoskeletal protein CcmA (bactofilin family)
MGMLDNWIAQKFGASQPSSKASAGGIPPSAAKSAAAESASLAVEAAPARKAKNYHSEALTAKDWASIDEFFARPAGREASSSASCLDGELTVGAGAVLKSDEIIQCKTLRVRGKLDAPIFAQLLIIEEGAVVTSVARVGTAEIRGTFTGTLQVHGTLTVHATGDASGKLRALEYQVAKAAKLAGDIKRVVPKTPEWIQHDDGEANPFDFPMSMMSMTMTKRAA